jgi:3-hydroxybutyryl-CoA dehydrogenase
MSTQTLSIKKVGVIGAGTMGHGIAQVCAMAGCEVVLCDLDAEFVEKALGKVQANLQKGVDRGKVHADLAESSLRRLSGTTDHAIVADDADLLIEAIPEKLILKQDLLSSLEAHAPESVIFGTNTSSLSVGEIASAVKHPENVIGMHFFNPVHIMKLLELVVHKTTSPEVTSAMQQFGQRIEKEVITVQDFPGFASSRLGVCLGMEAIRMVEQGVASPEDIDKAMSVGYRHPMGPLKLTDLVGLDVRMHIGDYLAQSLGNKAFEPPQLMRDMVKAGKLGKKTGQGFYNW